MHAYFRNKVVISEYSGSQAALRRRVWVSCAVAAFFPLGGTAFAQTFSMESGFIVYTASYLAVIGIVAALLHSTGFSVRDNFREINDAIGAYQKEYPHDVIIDAILSVPGKVALLELSDTQRFGFVKIVGHHTVSRSSAFMDIKSLNRSSNVLSVLLRDASVDRLEVSFTDEKEADRWFQRFEKRRTHDA